MGDLRPMIVTVNVFPPVPCRSYDWAACREGDEEGGPHGYGETEQDAINHLLDLEDEE